MVSWKGAAIGAGALALLTGLLLGTGIISVKKSDEHSASDDDDRRKSKRRRSDANESDEEDADDKAGGGKKKGKKKKGRARGSTDQLASLGYVDGMVDESVEKSGVEIHKRDKVFDGLNFYSSRKQAKAQLVDMEGHVVHVWEGVKTGAWQHVTLLPDGDVLALVKNKSVIRVDKDSKVEWTYEGKVHHDLWVQEDGTVHVLASRHWGDRKYDPKVPTVEDYIVVLSPEGKPIGEISVLGIIEKSPYAFLLGDARSLPSRKLHRPNPRAKIEYDILHTNHVEVLDGSLAGKNPAFKKGNLLVCPRNLHTIMVINPETEQVEWVWGTTKLMFPHHPTVTRDGTLLVFNNGADETGSQIVELDPGTGEIVWTYGPTKEFYSNTRGSNQRLPNGNTLITESDTGYVFEVTKEGEIVWQFLNPHTKPSEKLRMAIWRMTRHPRSELKFEFNRK